MEKTTVAVVSYLSNNQIAFVIEDSKTEEKEIIECCKIFFGTLYTNVEIQLQKDSMDSDLIFVTVSELEEPICLQISWCITLFKK